MNNLILLSTSAAEPLAQGGSSGFLDILLKVLAGLAAIAVVMCFAALSVVVERKVAAFIQGRHGPNRTCIPYVMLIPFVGKFLQKNGLMQLAADGLKFLLKEEPLPSHVNKFWYTLAPVMSLAPVLIATCAIPFGFYSDGGKACALAAADFDLSLLFVLALGSLGVYGAVMAGWSSNSKFSYLGGMRASAQMVSYEIIMMLSLVPIVLWIAPNCQSPLSLFELGKSQEAMWNIVKFPVCVFLGAWSPLPGFAYPLEWGWIAAALSVLTFLAKIAFMIFFFVWVRWTLPRFRYDHVMNLCWGKLLPLAVANLLAYIVLAAFIK